MGVATVLFVLGGCDRSAEQEASSESTSTASTEGEKGESGPTIEHPSGPSPDPGTVLARADGIEVSFGEYRHFMRESRLFAPAAGEGEVEKIPPERKADPRLQTQVIRSLIERALIRRAAKKHGVDVERSEIVEYLRRDDKLGRWAGAVDPDAGSRDALPDGLRPGDLREVGRMRLLRRKLVPKLIDVPDGERLWRAYRRRNETIRIAYVVLENTPTSGEIDAFVEQHEVEIEEYFEENREEYRMPKLARLAVVRAPSNAEAAERKLRRAAKLLGEGKSPERIARVVGLEAEDDAYVVRKENPEAFEAEKGETGWELEGPRGAYAWRLEGWKKGQEPSLDRGLRREVAADMLRRSLVPSVAEALEEVRGAMRDVVESVDGPIEPAQLEPVREVASEADASLETTEAFTWNEEGNVPGLGLARPVLDRVFELTSESPVVDGPVLTRGRAVVAVLLDRGRASRETFEENRKAFREKLRAQKKRGAVRRYVDEWFDEHDPSINLKPVQIEYGILRKK